MLKGFKAVKRNRGVAGIDKQFIKMFEAKDASNNKLNIVPCSTMFSKWTR